MIADPEAARTRQHQLRLQNWRRKAYLVISAICLSSFPIGSCFLFRFQCSVLYANNQFIIMSIFTKTSKKLKRSVAALFFVSYFWIIGLVSMAISNNAWICIRISKTKMTNLHCALTFHHLRLLHLFLKVLELLWLFHVNGSFYFSEVLMMQAHVFVLPLCLQCFVGSRNRSVHF